MESVQGRGFNAAVTRLWSLLAPIYDARRLQAWVYGPAHEEVLTVLRRAEPRRVADIGCGTGILAERIRSENYVGTVHGVDRSDGMLAKAKARSSATQWTVAPAEQLPFGDNTLDAIVSTSAFHFFDQPAALNEFRRVLVPGGIAAIATVSLPESHPIHRRTAGRRRPVHNPSPEKMRALFEKAGFTVEDQHRVSRPPVTKFISDVLTVGSKD
ncbi:class I SAM-dependent methyltransferase [Mycobacterium syngnathidarum]